VPKKHSLFMGVVVCSKTIQSVRRFRRSYELQVVLFVLLTAALPNLVGHLHSKGETRNKDNFLQPVWELVLTYIPSMASHFMFGSVCAMTTFFVSCLYFSYKDLMRHDTKIQKDWWPTLHDMIVAAVPQMLSYSAANYFTWILMDIRVDLPKNAPSIWEFMRDVGIMFIVGDFYIYYMHRTMHKFVFLRDNIHCVHHSYRKVFSWAGGWVHPLEDLTAVLTQVACPIWFLKPHPFCFWMFVSLWTLLMVDEHSGHDVWWSPYKWVPFGAGGGGAPHDIHHYKPNTNFGFVFNVWDILFCTMEEVSDWYPGKTDFEPWVGGKKFAPVNGFVPIEGWNEEKLAEMQKID